MMFGLRKTVRRLLAAALILAPLSAWAGITATLDAGFILITGIDETDRVALVQKPERVHLQRAGATGANGMLITLTADQMALRIKPRFALRPGRAYELKLNLSGDENFHWSFAVPAEQAEAPTVTGYAPNLVTIPANTLRFYLTFSQPMARGQVRTAIQLVRSDGSVIDNAFLNLDVELWDHGQQRLTLILDPGRIKQGVGPNTRSGAPLKAGETYSVVVSGAMKNADGQPMGTPKVIAFHVGPALRSALAPAKWKLDLPGGQSLDPLVITFDRAMDIGSTARLLWIEEPIGRRVVGRVRTDGLTWRIQPTSSWAPGAYRLVLDPGLEDVAGNTIRSAFDAKAGTMQTPTRAKILDFNVPAARQIERTN